MTAALVGFAAGVVAGTVIWRGLRPVFAAPLFERRNYRDRPIATATGIVLPIAVIAVEAVRAVGGAVGIGPSVRGTGSLSDTRQLMLLVVVGFALLGLVDDLAGSGDARGFRGHVASMVRGRVTTGGLKLVGGAAVALVAAGPVARGDTDELLTCAALVALAANLGNLFDRAPARVTKLSVAALVALVAATQYTKSLPDVAVVVGAAVALAPAELRERTMLGDTGANVLGAALGYQVVLSCRIETVYVVLAVVAALNLLSERVSFSRVIDAVAPLRALDRLGRRPPG